MHAARNRVLSTRDVEGGDADDSSLSSAPSDAGRSYRLTSLVKGSGRRKAAKPKTPSQLMAYAQTPPRSPALANATTTSAIKGLMTRIKSLEASSTSTTSALDAMTSRVEVLEREQAFMMQDASDAAPSVPVSSHAGATADLEEVTAKFSDLETTVRETLDKVAEDHEAMAEDLASLSTAVDELQEAVVINNGESDIDLEAETGDEDEVSEATNAEDEGAFSDSGDEVSVVDEEAEGEISLTKAEEELLVVSEDDYEGDLDYASDEAEEVEASAPAPAVVTSGLLVKVTALKDLDIRLANTGTSGVLASVRKGVVIALHHNTMATTKSGETWGRAMAICPEDGSITQGWVLLQDAQGVDHVGNFAF